MSEKYLDFSFEKTNSAYMLFYEWRSNNGKKERDQCGTPTSSTSSSINNDLRDDQKPGCSKDVTFEMNCEDGEKVCEPIAVAALSSNVSSPDEENSKSLLKNKLETENSSNLNSISDKLIDNNECDIDDKLNTSASSTASNSEHLNNDEKNKIVNCNKSVNNSSLMAKSPPNKKQRKSLLNKELEDWIWQDNRHYLEDRNIFEHTYFK